MLMLLLATLVVVGAGGLLYLQKLDAMAREEAESKLAAVAQLKIRELTQWRKERLQGATYIRRTPYVARRAPNVLAHPGSKVTQSMFTGWLDAMLANHEYTQAILLDTNVNVCLAHPAKPPAPAPEALRQAVEKALRTRQVTEAGLYRISEGDRCNWHWWCRWWSAARARTTTCPPPARASARPTTVPQRWCLPWIRRPFFTP